MRLHTTAIEKLIQIYKNYGGYPEEKRLRAALAETDFTEYTQQSGPKNTILVLTEDYNKHLARNQQLVIFI